MITIKVDKTPRLNTKRQVKEMEQKEMQKSEIVRIINELRAKGWSDTEIVEFLLKVETD